MEGFHESNQESCLLTRDNHVDSCVTVPLESDWLAEIGVADLLVDVP